MKTVYRLAALAEESGTPPRTIRFYIAKGILPGPSQVGRDAVYGREHVKRLHQIAALKKKGQTLAEIAQTLSPKPVAEELPHPSACASYALSDDVTVIVRSDVPPWRMNKIRRMLSKMITQLQKEPDDEHNQS